MSQVDVGRRRVEADPNGQPTLGRELSREVRLVDQVDGLRVGEARARRKMKTAQWKPVMSLVLAKGFLKRQDGCRRQPEVVCRGPVLREGLTMRKLLVVISLDFSGGGRARAEDLPYPGRLVRGRGAVLLGRPGFQHLVHRALDVDRDYRCFIGGAAVVGRRAELYAGSARGAGFRRHLATLRRAGHGRRCRVQVRGRGGPLVVTSRFFSTSPNPTVGMFVPGLDLRWRRDDGPDLGSKRCSGAGFPDERGGLQPRGLRVTCFRVFDGERLSARGNAVVSRHAGFQISQSSRPPAPPRPRDYDNAVIVVDGRGGVVPLTPRSSTTGPPGSDLRGWRPEDQPCLAKIERSAAGRRRSGGRLPRRPLRAPP